MRSARVWTTLLATAAVLSTVDLSAGQLATAGESRVGYPANEANHGRNETKNTEFVSSGTKPRPLFGDVMADAMRNFLPFSDVNKNCTRDGRQFAKSLSNRTLWAVRMYDSSSKYPGGTLRGDEVTDLGHFDQCMSVSSEQFGIRGAHAIAVVRFRFSDDDDDDSVRKQSGPPEVEIELQISSDSPTPRLAGPGTLFWALCVPDSCTNDDVKFSIEHTLIPVFQTFNVVIDVGVPPSMYTSKDSMLDNTNNWALLLYGILITSFILVVTGTAYDLLMKHSKPENITLCGSCLQSFSIVSNTKNLVADVKNTEFAISNGLKTVGIVSVIIGHRVALDMGMPAYNPEHTEHIFTDFWLSVLKSPVSVEIFFIVSGFFTYNIITERLEHGKPLRFMYLLIYRLARIFPTYTTVLLMFAFILPYIGDGPLWKLIVYPEAEFCRKNWWTNILFINNYVNTDEMCMLHSWYLACDMHFFIVGTFLCYVLWKWKKAGIGIFCGLFALSIYLPAKFIFDNKQWGVMPYFHSNIKNLRTTEHFQKVYIKSHHRITTYLVGLAAAYIYRHVKRSKFKFSIANRTIGFVLSFSLHWACYAATGYLYLPGLKYDPWNHLLYFTFQRIVYSLTISYVLVVGSLSNFGFISSIFECKLFTVIARISYVMYLTSFIVQLQSIGQIRQPLYGSFWTLYWEVNADVLTSVSYSLAINLIVEAPVRKIFNRLMNVSAEVDPDKSDANVAGENNGAVQTGKFVLPQFQEAHKL